MKRLIAGLMFLLPGCHALPQDPGDTLQRIEHTRKFTVGIVAGSQPGSAAERLVHQVEHASRAHAERAQGDAEKLLRDLSDGRIDLVVGAFAQDSPWKTEVSFGPPISASDNGKHSIEMKAAMRNGENRWIVLVERASRKIAGGASDQ